MRAAAILLLCIAAAEYCVALPLRNHAVPKSDVQRGSSALLAAAAAGATHGRGKVLHHQHHQHRLGVRKCAPGCEQNGNCNRALGVCECPVGYTGPNCTQPLWPSCKEAPQQQELYCTNDWKPKSCACLKQCADFVCPDGTHASCERDFDLFNSKCFVRPSGNQSLPDGGSDLPEDTEEGVRFYKGWLHKDVTQEISRYRTI